MLEVVQSSMLCPKCVVDFVMWTSFREEYLGNLQLCAYAAQ